MPIPNQSAAWQDPPPEFSLDEGDVHIWRVEFEQWYPQLPRLRSLLSAAESVRAQRYVFERDQANFSVARATLRRLLSKYLDLEPAEIVIETSERGKPFVSNQLNLQRVTFNLSHSDCRCLIAISRDRRLGVDLEKIRHDLEPLELATRYFTQEECGALRALPADLRLLGFFQCWTCKEAYVKARGDGLQVPLDQFSITVDPESPVVLKSHDSELWEIASLSSFQDFASAIVIERPVNTVNLWNLR